MAQAVGQGRDRRLSALAAVVAVLGIAYVISLLPFVRGDAGTLPLFDVWLNLIVKAGVVAVVMLRGWIDRRMRAAWWSLGLGLFAAFLASVAYYTYYRHLDPVPFPSWADAGFVAFYLLGYAAIVLMLRERIRPLPRSVWHDALIAALTAAAFAAAFVLEPALEETGGRPAVVAVTLAYVAADLVLVMFLAGAFVVMGVADRTWGWLAAGLFLFFVTDALYVNAAASGSYEAGDPLDIGWTLARLCFIAAAVATFRQGRVIRRDTMLLLVAPAFCAVAALALLYVGTRGELPLAATTLALLAVLTALSRTAFAFTERERHERARKILAAEEEERARLARELHDEVGQRLTAALLHLKRASRESNEDWKRELERATEVVRGSLGETREIASRLRPEALDDLGLRSALLALCERVGSGAQIAIDAELAAPVPALDPEQELVAYRIAQEALTNVARHADAGRAWLSLVQADGMLLLGVEDDGRGFGADASPGAGLAGMRERALLVSGTLEIGASERGGTAVRLVLPLAVER